jgi:valyl-tRNA synthetase
VFVLPGMRGVVPGVIDPVKERERLSRQLGKIEKDLGVLEKKLTNEKFVSGAPPEVVEQTKRDAAELAEKRDQMSAAIHAAERRAQVS